MMNTPPDTFVAQLEAFLADTEPVRASVLREVGLAPVHVPDGVDPSSFRLVMLGFATYDHHNHPAEWVGGKSAARLAFIWDWATWAFTTEIEMAMEDGIEPDFFYLQQIVQQFQAREIPHSTIYMDDYFA